nr:HisA/HisF-related TIM barrel protein [Pseudomonadales bacterium]
ISSILTARAEPQYLSAAFEEHFGFTDLYVADLDAIAGQAANAKAVESLLDSPTHIWLDAGTATLSGMASIARQISIDRVDRVIVGLECCPSHVHLQQVFEWLGPDRAVFSLDLSAGVPLLPGTVPGEESWNTTAPFEIARQAVEMGFNKMIVLDLAAIGMGRGVETLALCSQLAELSETLELTSGGGVCGVDDLRSLSRAGCQNALVASALHDGRITAEMLGSL